MLTVAGCKIYMPGAVQFHFRTEVFMNYLNCMSELVKGKAGRLLQMISLEIDFYGAEAHAGTSFKPFIGFMMFFAGFVIIFIGIVKINDAKKQWNLFYDQRDRKDFSEPKYEKEKRTGKILVAAGVILILLSFILLPL